MKKLLLGILILFLIASCNTKQKNDYLVKFHIGEIDEIGSPTGYLNSRGDTIIPIEKYFYGYADTIRNFGMVMENGTGKILGIDKNANELFEVFRYDNGPDNTESGLFRIIKDGKIGYANSQGKVIIEPKFDCAYAFEGEFAKVSDDCQTLENDESNRWKSNAWYHITKEGKRKEN